VDKCLAVREKLRKFSGEESLSGEERELYREIKGWIGD
jgi:hypothetical protein